MLTCIGMAVLRSNSIVWTLSITGAIFFLQFLTKRIDHPFKWIQYLSIGCIFQHHFPWTERVLAPFRLKRLFVRNFFGIQYFFIFQLKRRFLGEEPSSFRLPIFPGLVFRRGVRQSDTSLSFGIGSAAPALALVRWRFVLARLQGVEHYWGSKVSTAIICFLGCSCFPHPQNLSRTCCCLRGYELQVCPQTAGQGPTMGDWEYPLDWGGQTDGWTNISWSSLSLLKIKTRECYTQCNNKI